MSLSDLLYAQDGVCTRGQLLQLGYTDAFIRHRIEHGIWRLLSHGVYLTQPSPPSHRQRVRAAALACAPEGLITGRAALVVQGIRVDAEERVQVLLPTSRKKYATTLYQPIRGRWLPEPTVFDGIPYAPVPVAAIHSCRGLVGIRDVRAVLSAVVQQQGCSAADLVIAAYRLGRVRALVRDALKELRDGIRSVPEGDVRRLIQSAGLPMPLFNPVILDLDGQVICCPDVYWEDAGVALEVESKQFHFYAEGWDRTLNRRSHMSSYGILVVQASPERIRNFGELVMADVRRALESSNGRGRLPLIVRKA